MQKKYHQVIQLGFYRKMVTGVSLILTILSEVLIQLIHSHPLLHTKSILIGWRLKSKGKTNARSGEILQLN